MNEPIGRAAFCQTLKLGKLPGLLSLLILLSSCALIPWPGADLLSKPAVKSVAEKSTARKVVTRFETFQKIVYFDSQFKTPEPIIDEGMVSIDIPKTLKQKVQPKGIEELQTLIAKRSQENLLYCKRIDRRLKSVSLRNCLLKEHLSTNHVSAGGLPIYMMGFAGDTESKSLGKVLVLGGVHGDELTSISTVYLWVQTLFEFHSGLFDWKIVPVVNPDGFFLPTPSRTNANGVDLNRNLPTYQWRQLATRYWEKYASKTKRKFPGYNPASEPETQWLVDEINRYQPDVIVTVHAPYNLVDYDAADRANAPRRLGILKGKSLGTFPGSLGRFAGEERNIPVITLELPHSTRMPSRESIDGIWVDLVAWLRQNINSDNIAHRSFNHCSNSPGAEGCI